MVGRPILFYRMDILRPMLQYEQIREQALPPDHRYHTFKCPSRSAVLTMTVMATPISQVPTGSNPEKLRTIPSNPQAMPIP